MSDNLITTPLRDEPKIMKVTVDNIGSLKGIWVKVVSVTKEHLLSMPKDIRFVNKRIKILNKCFFVEEANGCVAILPYGAEIEISKHSLK